MCFIMAEHNLFYVTKTMYLTAPDQWLLLKGQTMSAAYMPMLD